MINYLINLFRIEFSASIRQIKDICFFFNLKKLNLSLSILLSRKTRREKLKSYIFENKIVYMKTCNPLFDSNTR